MQSSFSKFFRLQQNSQYKVEAPATISFYLVSFWKITIDSNFGWCMIHTEWRLTHSTHGSVLIRVPDCWGMESHHHRRSPAILEEARTSIDSAVGAVIDYPPLKNIRIRSKTSHHTPKMVRRWLHPCCTYKVWEDHKNWHDMERCRRPPCLVTCTGWWPEASNSINAWKLSVQQMGWLSQVTT